MSFSKLNNTDKNLEVLVNINHEFEHLKQYLAARENTLLGEFYRKILASEKILKDNKILGYGWLHDIYFTEQDAEYVSYDATIKSLENEYANQKSNEMIDKLREQKQDKIEDINSSKKILEDRIHDLTALGKYAELKEIKDYFTLVEEHKKIENSVTKTKVKVIKKPKKMIDNSVQRSIEDLPQNKEITPKLDTNIDKLIYAIETTENKFSKEGDNYSRGDLANYLMSGNLFVFTSTNGARDLMKSVDYRELISDVKIKIAENLLKIIGHGVLDCPDNQILNTLLRKVQMSLNSSSMSLSFSLDEELENILNNPELQFDLSQAVSGNINLKKVKFKDKNLPPHQLFSVENLDFDNFKLGDENYNYTNSNTLNPQEIKNIYDTLFFEIENLKQSYGKKSVYDDYDVKSTPRR